MQPGGEQTDSTKKRRTNLEKKRKVSYTESDIAKEKAV